MITKPGPIHRCKKNFTCEKFHTYLLHTLKKSSYFYFTNSHISTEFATTFLIKLFPIYCRRTSLKRTIGLNQFVMPTEILLIDDDPDELEILTDALHTIDKTITCAQTKNLKEAL